MAKTRRTQSGSILEGTVKSIFIAKKFEFIRYREWAKNPHKYSQELLLCNVPFTTIYSHKGNTEFLLKSKKYGVEIRIECKWQQTSGSVDEKLPYLYLNAIEAMPENDIIIIIDGSGWKKGAIAWLEDAINQNKYTAANSQKKKIRVFDLSGFLTWANTTFR